MTTSSQVEAQYPDLDPFWVERREEFLAAKSTVADPSACGTCRGNVEAGKPVEHDECAKRATLLQAPDHPYYEILAGFTLAANEQLPARFHIPVFDDCGKPNAWLCAVCQEEGTVVQWPCKTAMEQGTKVFTPEHQAETAQKKLLAELATVRAERDELREELGSLERNTLPDLRRQIQHHQDGKKRWRGRAESAEQRLDAVRALCDEAEKQATRWEHPLPVPEWVEAVRRTAEGATS